jgi:regulatory protein
MNRNQDEELKRGKKYCLRLLSLRSRSEYEIEARLKNHGYPAQARKGILDSLKNDGYINDLKFAKEWIDSRIRSNPRGIRMLTGELKQKGVPEDIIKKALTDKAGELDEREIASGLIRDRLRSIKTTPEEKLKGKLFRFLLSKGFDPEISEDVIVSEFRIANHEHK